MLILPSMPSHRGHLDACRAPPVSSSIIKAKVSALAPTGFELNPQEQRTKWWQKVGQSVNFAGVNLFLHVRGVS